MGYHLTLNLSVRSLFAYLSRRSLAGDHISEISTPENGVGLQRSRLEILAILLVEDEHVVVGNMVKQFASMYVEDNFISSNVLLPFEVLWASFLPYVEWYAKYDKR